MTKVFVSDVLVSGALKYIMGAATFIRPRGIMYSSGVAVGNLGTGIDILHQYTMPAGALAVLGDSVWLEAYGTFANNAATKAIYVYFGGVLVGSSGAGYASAARRWVIRARVTRTAAATQRGWVDFMIKNTASATDFNSILDTSALTSTLSGALELSVRCQTTTDNDVICDQCTMGFDPVP